MVGSTSVQGDESLQQSVQLDSKHVAIFGVLELTVTGFLLL